MMLLVAPSGGLTRRLLERKVDQATVGPSFRCYGQKPTKDFHCRIISVCKCMAENAVWHAVPHAFEELVIDGWVNETAVVIVSKELEPKVEY